MESLHRLRILREVALRGSFTAAGEALHLSQPAVSQHISTLERELGTRLVERSVTGARLTAAGDIALRHGLRILQAADAARREIDGLASGRQTTIRIAAFSTACTYLLPSATRALRRRHPNVEFELSDCPADEAVERVRLSRADLGVTFDYATHPLDLEGLEVRHVADDPVRLAIPDQHHVALSTVVDVRDLAEEPWISGTAFACRESLLTVCGAAGFAPRIALDSDRYVTTLGLISAGHGVALVPESALGNPPPGVVIRTLDPLPPPRRIWAVTADEPTGQLADLVDVLTTALRGLPRTR